MTTSLKLKERLAVELLEYEVAEKQLTTDQAIALSETRVVTTRRAWAPNVFEVTAGPIVGALRVGSDLELRVSPKLPVRRVVYLLAHAAGLASWDDRLLSLDDDATIDVALATAFTVAAERALSRGPGSGYFTVEAELQMVRGRLDSNRQRRRFGFPLPVATVYDEYGTDIAENQLLAGAILLLERLPSISVHLRRRLRRLGQLLEGVRPAARHESGLPVHFTRLNEHYRPAVALARVVIEGSSFDVPTGRRSVTGFTVNMHKLFEQFLQVTLSEAVRRRGLGRLHSQRPDHLDQGRLARIVPDLTWIVGRAPLTVIDAKYKTLEEGRPSDDDLYQVIAYCVALGARQAYLVHATAPAVPVEMIVGSAGIIVHIAGLDLGSPLDQLHFEIEALADSIVSELALSAAV